MSGSIRLSEKHGVNPSMGLCFFCGQENGEIILPGKMKGDVKAPRQAVWNYDPCDECKKLMGMGVMVIEVRAGSDPENPYRTGRLTVIKVGAAQRIGINTEKNRAVFMEEEPYGEFFGSAHKEPEAVVDAEVDNKQFD